MKPGRPFFVFAWLLCRTAAAQPVEGCPPDGMPPSIEILAEASRLGQSSFVPFRLEDDSRTERGAFETRPDDGALAVPLRDGCSFMTQQGVGVEVRADADLLQRVAATARREAFPGTPAGTLQSQRVIFYVNGVKTANETHCRTLKKVANSTCAGVIGVYNATDGFLVDAGQTMKDRHEIHGEFMLELVAPGSSTIPTNRNPAVATLTAGLLTELLAGRSPEVWAHSQGGAVASLALYDVRKTLRWLGKEDLISKVRVSSFGSAAPMWPDGPRYEHYVHIDDGTPIMLGLGRWSYGDWFRAGAGAKVHRFKGEVDPKIPFAGVQERSLPSPTAYHDVLDVYLKRFGEVHAGPCGTTIPPSR